MQCLDRLGITQARTTGSAPQRRWPHVEAGHEVGSPQRVEPALGTVPADGFHGDCGLAARATLLKPELRQRFGHPGSPPSPPDDTGISIARRSSPRLAFLGCLVTFHGLDYITHPR